MMPYREPVKSWLVFDHTCRRCSRWGFKKLYEPWVDGAGPLCISCFIEWSGGCRGQFGVWSVDINFWPLDFSYSGRYQYIINCVETKVEPLDFNLKLPNDFYYIYHAPSTHINFFELVNKPEKLFSKIRNKIYAYFKTT